MATVSGSRRTHALALLFEQLSLGRLEHDFLLDLRRSPHYAEPPLSHCPAMASDKLPAGHFTWTPPHTRFEGAFVPDSSMQAITSQPFTLPTAPENDWRFSYQFLPTRSDFVARVMLGVGILGFVLVVANAAW